MKYVLIAILAVVGADASARGNASYQCREGEVQIFPGSGNADSNGYEFRTCQNGSFFPPYQHKEIGPICNDGETWLVPGSESDNGGGYDFRTCKNGRLFPPSVAPRVRGCTEGETLLGPDPRSNTGEGAQLVELVCRRGSFVPRY
jgi:hypothetical protein